MIQRFCKYRHQLLAAHSFRKSAPSDIFDRVLNIHLICFSFTETIYSIMSLKYSIVSTEHIIKVVYNGLIRCSSALNCVFP